VNDECAAPLDLPALRVAGESSLEQGNDGATCSVDL